MIKRLLTLMILLPTFAIASSTGPGYRQCDDPVIVAEFEQSIAQWNALRMGPFERDFVTEGVFDFEIGDDPGEGYNDPVFGPLRRQALVEAGRVLSQVITTDVPIHVFTRFDPVGGTASGGNLGAATSHTWIADFANAPIPGLKYPPALANAYAGTDLNGTTYEGWFRMNSSVDDPALFCGDWYYGVDANPPTHTLPDGRVCTDFDAMTVMIHEIVHGLGFTTLASKSTGDWSQGGIPDITAAHFEDHASGVMWPDLSGPAICGEGYDNFLRIKSGTSLTGMHFLGPNMNVSLDNLTDGFTDTLEGRHLQIYAPAFASWGSSWSHFDRAVTPNDLMEPYYTDATHDTTLVAALLHDIGWPVAGGGGTPSTTTTSTSTTSTTTTTTTLPPGCMEGDVNGDGKVDMEDAEQLLSDLGYDLKLKE